MARQRTKQQSKGKTTHAFATLDLARSVPSMPSSRGKPSALLDTRVVYCGAPPDLEQLAKLPDASVVLAELVTA